MTRGIRVIHVDDDTQFSDLTVEFLESIDERLTVESIPDPTAALEVIDPEGYDCVISDYDMPEMNGIAFLESVRERFPDLPFILFTGKGSEEVASDAISAGVTDYLQKNPGSDQFRLLANRITNAVEQRRATEAAEETERRLTELAENTTDALWMFTGDWEELLFVNSVVTDLFGVSPAELYREPERFREHIHLTHREQVERAMDQVTEGYPIELEYQVTPPNGSPRWVWLSCEPILDETGEVVRIVGFTRDITERKRRERERREAARRLDLVLDSVQACIWMRDDDRRFLLANEEFHGTFGVEQGVDVVGCLAEDLMEERTARALAALDDEVLETGEPLEREQTLPTADGEATYLIRITPRFDERGEITVTCGIATDITPRKQRVERLKERSQRLTALTGIITGELLPVLERDDRTDGVAERVLAIASDESPTCMPVNIGATAQTAWNSIRGSPGRLLVSDPPIVEANEQLIEQLLRSLFRGVVSIDGTAEVTVSQYEKGFVVKTPAVDGFSSMSDVSERMDEIGLQLTVSRWIAARHGWKTTVETTDEETHIAFTNVTIIND